jgi:hypothetical protein
VSTFVETLSDLPDAITLARIDADISGSEADTIATLAAALYEAGAVSFTLTVEG